MAFSGFFQLFLDLLQLDFHGPPSDKRNFIALRIQFPRHIALIQHDITSDGNPVLIDIADVLTFHDISQQKICVKTGVRILRLNFLRQRPLHRLLPELFSHLPKVHQAHIEQMLFLFRAAVNGNTAPGPED